MVNVCFITPPSAFLLDERVFMSLGILKVAAACEQFGFHVEHLDLTGVSNYEETAVLHASKSESDVFALTATTPQMPAAYQTAQRLWESGAKLILGGPHVTLTYAAVKQEQKRGIQDRAHRALAQLQDTFDVLVSGDGEFAIYYAVSAPSGSIIDADDPKGPWFLGNEAVSMVWPARHLVDVSTYHYAIDGEPALSLIGQLGCPFGCKFCAGRDTAFLRKVRLRSPSAVFTEMMDGYYRYGIQGWMFLDDELNVNQAMLPLMELLAAAPVDWKLRGFIKAELFTDEQAVAMHAAGFRQILIGFESGDDRILRNIQKNATRDDNTRAMAIAHRHGLKVKALMSVGHAGESEASILATRDWLLEVKPDDFDVTVIQPYPGSPYYDHATPVADGYCYTAQNQDRLYMRDVDFTSEAQFYKGMPGTYHSFVWTDHLSRERICKLRDEVETDVRKRLNIPFYPTGTNMRFEASMGQLPGYILRQGTQ